MKVCYVLSHFYPYVGGAEQAFFDLMQVLVEKDVEIRVVTTSVNGKNEHIKYKNLDIYYYNWKQLMGHPLVKKSDIIEHIEWADVVNTAVYSPVPVVTKVCRKLNKPVLCDVYEVLGFRWYWVESNFVKAFMLKMYEKFIINQKCDFFITSSHATENDLLRYNKKAKCKTVYRISEPKENPTKLDKKKYYDYFGINKDNVVFLNYGRPGKTKGIFVYLDAIKKLVEKLGDKKLKKVKFCFIMAKEPHKERSKFIKKVSKYNLQDYIIVKESVSREDLDNYRDCADYIVVPSITEGFGLSAIEACEAGKKLIHSSGGSLPEVTFGEVAEFENRNSDSLEEVLEKIVLNKIKYKTKKKKDFSKENMASQYYEAYKALLKK